MKITRLFATIGLMVTSMGTATVADAQRGDRYERHHDGRGDRDFRNDRGRHGFRDDRRGYRNDRRSYRNNRRDRCRIEYRHHRQVRVCR